MLCLEQRNFDMPPRTWAGSLVEWMWKRCWMLFFVSSVLASKPRIINGRVVCMGAQSDGALGESDGMKSFFF